MELFISLLALAVSIASAYFTFQSRKEAKQANNIAIHQHQKEIFNTFNKLRAELNQLGEQFNLETLNAYSACAYTADFYLTQGLASNIKTYNHFANKIYIRHQMNKVIEKNDRPVPEQYLNELWSSVDKCRELEDGIEAKLRDELNLKQP